MGGVGTWAWERLRGVVFSVREGLVCFVTNPFKVSFIQLSLSSPIFLSSNIVQNLDDGINNIPSYLKLQGYPNPPLTYPKNIVLNPFQNFGLHGAHVGESRMDFKDKFKAGLELLPGNTISCFN